MSADTPLSKLRSNIHGWRGSARVGLVALSLAIGFTGCAPSQQTGAESGSAPAADAPQAERPEVVATTSLLCDVTRQIAQETIDLTCLMQPDQDPHVYQATPSDRQAIETAELVLYGGYGYEPELIRIVQATQTSAPKVAVYEAAVPNPLIGASDEHDHGEEHSEAGHSDTRGEEHAEEHAEAGHDHDHEQEQAQGGETSGEASGEALVPDPHVWHDAVNGVKIAEAVEDQLSKLLPDRANEFQQNTAALTAELTQINDWIKTQAASVPAGDRQIVMPHNAFQYFAKAYGFTIKGALDGLSTEEKPSPARLAELVDTVQDSGVKAIFSETTTNPSAIESVARSAGVQVAEQPLFIEGPGGEGTAAPNYQAMLVENTCTVVEALGGQCDRSSVASNP